ncbi:MAG: twin-arginine translocase TatA/TatE family subunit [Fimbriimonadaceae bacterium]|nr:twin-arginine translocase TatA/TatE family subunit [Fimbriimonadaceae bacterium]
MGTEWVWVILIFVLLFGAKKLPELARSAGESLKEFKKATREAAYEDDTQKTAEAPRRMEVSPEESTSSSTSA